MRAFYFTTRRRRRTLCEKLFGSIKQRPGNHYHRRSAVTSLDILRFGQVHELEEGHISLERMAVITILAVG